MSIGHRIHVYKHKNLCIYVLVSVQLSRSLSLGYLCTDVFYILRRTSPYAVDVVVACCGARQRARKAPIHASVGRTNGRSRSTHCAVRAKIDCGSFKSPSLERHRSRLTAEQTASSAPEVAEASVFASPLPISSPSTLSFALLGDRDCLLLSLHISPSPRGLASLGTSAPQQQNLSFN